jgi:hypothetical protein
MPGNYGADTYTDSEYLYGSSAYNPAQVKPADSYVDTSYMNSMPLPSVTPTVAASGTKSTSWLDSLNFTQLGTQLLQTTGTVVSAIAGKTVTAPVGTYPTGTTGYPVQQQSSSNLLLFGALGVALFIFARRKKGRR